MSTCRGTVNCEAVKTLQSLLHPITVEQFFADYWEAAALPVRRADPAFYEELFSLKHLDLLLSDSYANGLRDSEFFRMSQDGELLSEKEYTREVRSAYGTARADLDLDHVYGLFQSGATITLNQIHLTCGKVGALCRRLEQLFGVRVTSNAYLTPTRSQGFATHHDTHDVFVLQVHGRKRWRLYSSPLPLATPETPNSPALLKLITTAPDEIELSAGDLLYLPRGCAHDATASDDISLHLTVGVHPYTWADAIRDVISASVPEEIDLRQSVLPRLSHEFLDSALVERFRAVVNRLSERADILSVLQRRVENFSRDSRPILNGQLEQITRSQTIQQSTHVRVRDTAAYELSETAETLELSFHGKVVQFPLYVKPQIEFILSQPHFCPRDLPHGLDAQGREVLVRRLVNEGLLFLPADAEIESDIRKDSTPLAIKPTYTGATATL